MFRVMTCACALVVCVLPVALSQNTTPACNAGINADGFIDFSGLPTSPFIPGNGFGSGTSTPVTATMPVKGVPGLTVTVTIPALTSINEGIQVYGVDSGTLKFFSDPNSGYVQLAFNKPVYGVSFEGNANGQDASFSLVTNSSEAAGKGIQTSPPATIQTSVTNAIERYYHFNNKLQAVGDISEAFLYFPHASFDLPTIGNVRVQSKPAPDEALVPRNGLHLWLKSESALDPYAVAPLVNKWPDQSLYGHDATQNDGAHMPGQLGASGPNCRGEFRFQGQSYFNFNLPISGWDEMTVFLVARTFADPPAGSYASAAAALLWDESAPWGNTFIAPAQTAVPFRFGTQQVNNQPIDARSYDVGQDLTVTRAVHNRSVDALYVDGIEVLAQQNKQPVLAGTNGAAFLGRGINNTYFNGAISEVLVYNRVLLQQEAADVEQYLRDKFGTR